MKVVLATVGSRGDVQPIAVLAGALVDRGHDVVLLGPPEGRSLLDSRVTFVPSGRDVMAWLQRFDAATVGVTRIFGAFRELVEEDLHLATPLMIEAAAGANVIVSAGLHLLARTAAEVSGAAAAYVHYSPHLLPSDEHPPIVVPLQRLPRLANRAFHNVTQSFLSRIMLRPLNRERRALGLAPHTSIVDVVPDDLMLAYDAAIAPAPTDLVESWRRHGVTPRRVHQVGALQPAPQPLDPALSAFVDDDRCVYVGFGSMPDHDAAATVALVDAAAAAAGVRAVMLGKAESTERVLVVPAASHGSLFPRMSAVVHHGGAGTTAAASRAGAPQVVVPHFLDQPYWAHRLSLRGVSAGTIRRRELTAAKLGDALRRAVSDDALRERARGFADELNATDPVAASVDLLERMGARA